MLHVKFGFDWPSGFRGEDVFNIMVIYMSIAPVWGHMSPWVQFFFRIIDIQSYYPFPARFSPQMTLKSFPHSNAFLTYVDLAIKKVKVITGS